MFFWSVFGLALRKALVYFRHDLVQALAQMRIVTKSFWVVFQAGWSPVYSPLGALDQLLTLGCVDSTWTTWSPSPSTPPCAPTVSGENLLIPFIIWSYVYVCYADHMERSTLKYKTSAIASLHWFGAWYDIWGENSSSSWGKETHLRWEVFWGLGC